MRFIVTHTDPIEHETSHKTLEADSRAQLLFEAGWTCPMTRDVTEINVANDDGSPGDLVWSAEDEWDEAADKYLPPA